jgi:hypothetical protein
MISMKASLLGSGSPRGSALTLPSFTVAQAALTEMSLQIIPLDPPPGVLFLGFLREQNDSHVVR